MKLKQFVFIAIVSVVGISAMNGCNEYSNGGSSTLDNENRTEATGEKTTGTLNGHDWVDLGLPSGTKWATCNVGANTPESNGKYYAWGETTTKNVYSDDNYTYKDSPSTLPASADAATANWGNGWRMPTKVEMTELYSKCSFEWTTQKGVNGEKFTGPNGNSIFLPASGFREEYELIREGTFGDYWSSTPNLKNPSEVYLLYFNSENCIAYDNYRHAGLPIRPVCN